MKLSDAIKRLAVDAVDAQSPMELILGDVVSVSPLNVRLNENDKLIIPEDLLMWPARLDEDEDDALEEGDSVMVIAMTGGQIFYILDKVVGGGS
ncbi:DUF2577 family protein [Bacillus altitudinis]|uniref:DUF2577 family protein n=1 Tax=Bacillus altitudinis TaxID=293387 RepID=UPI0022831C71|nr:DUF2577 family protein [Bacillus altitudinis]MCY7498251.1 DUF2577 domain-containing protein [Bacillus altitudinis]MCY7535468.1 DUF2577 domain-containing protein [Bacillus altitudinis]MCY7545485.1 DUF2577 domain-containing protein [Bacillus altitudinis]MCY7553585.1 DUF2577 domain-containing protein [Bacillus altitudinis]MCY7592179.1 DUF2577 domain-containing protein [Bacillus altitudinis]